jgi:hypothetical protein
MLTTHCYCLIVMQSRLNSSSPLTAIATLPALLLTLFLPIRPAAAENQFDVCVLSLKSNGVQGEQAGTACADALIPKELSACVSHIKSATPIEAEDALQACYQVRRPVDLGNCVADIYNSVLKSSLSSARTKQVTPAEPAKMDSPESTPAENPAASEDPPLTVLLNSCRLSLLPGRHSECAIALSRTIPDMTPVKAMQTCLDAEDFPRDLFPAYSN